MTSTEPRGWSYTMCRRAGIVALAFAFVLLSMTLATQSAQAQSYSVLYSFTGGTDGLSPWDVIRDGKGNLYGTTYLGGDPTCVTGLSEPGCGVVFKLDTAGKLTVLHTFLGGADGAIPWGSLTRDRYGNLYGTASSGGNVDCFPPSGCGLVFKLDANGNYAVLHAFTGEDGSSPAWGQRLILDAAGNVYGSTMSGGAYGWGAIFKIDLAGTYTLLYSFPAGPDRSPSSLISDGKAFYGVSAGGVNNLGAVFKVGWGGQGKELYSFGGSPDGEATPYAGLVRDRAGNLYGTTLFGGNSGCYYGSCGTVFKLNLKTGTETVLYRFTGGADGGSPWASLIRDPAGNLYGTTTWGGAYGLGSVFELDTFGNETVLHSFGPDGGSSPQVRLTRDSAGNLFGTAGGGAYGYGVVFKISLP